MTLTKCREFAVLAGVVSMLAVVGGGCYNYESPSPSPMSDTYTQREKSERDDLFKDMKQLTRAEAQRIALKNNPTYIAAYHSVSAARMRYYQSWGAYSPKVTASFQLQDRYSGVFNGYTYLNSPARTRTENFTTTTGISATLLLFDGLEREFSLLASKHSLEYQKMLEEDQCRSMMRAVAVAYNTVLLAIENRRISEEDRKFQLETLKDTKYKFDAGAVPLSDVLNFEILANDAEVSLANAEYQYENAIYALAVLMGYPEGTLPAELTFPSDFKSDFGDLPAVEIYLDAALSHRPDLKGYREQLEIAKYQLYRTYSSYSPTVNAFATFSFGTNETHTRYHSYGNNGVHYSSNETRSYYNQPSFAYGITADWTIFNGLIRYNTMREYKANLAAAEYSAAAKWFEVVGEVRSAYANYLQSVRQTRLYEKNLELSKKQRDLVDEEYRAGNAELTRLNEAQRDLVRAETNLASSYIAIQNAKAQLDSAVGANTAEFYMNQNEDSVNGFPGLESLNGADDGPGKAADTEEAAQEDKTPAAKPQQTNAPAAAQNGKDDAKPQTDDSAKKGSAAPAIPARADAPPPAKK